MRTRSWAAVVLATKKKDALTIGLPVAGGAAIGALINGIKGEGIGALPAAAPVGQWLLMIGGKDARVPVGVTLVVRLTEPLTVRVDDRR